jgi:hypothetical protein
VTALSGSNAWAVGAFTTSCQCASRTLIAHWNGTTWRRIASPNPTPNDSLSAVSARAAHDVWAVGAKAPAYSSHAWRTLIMHWNGAKWTTTRSPNPGKVADYVQGVAAVSATTAWAVGKYCATACGDPSHVGHPLILRWNGARWSQVATPNPCVGGASLTSVTANSISEAWAAGACGTKNGTLGVFLLHWNGERWSRATVPSLEGDTELYGISASSSRNVWAAGSQIVFNTSTGNVSHTLILHWNGSSWRRAPSPDPGNGNYLLGVSASSGSNAWAVGSGGGTPTSPSPLPVLLHWNGRKWSDVPAPSSPSVDYALVGISTDSAKDAWTVGVRGPDPSTATLVMHWNGIAWAKM